MSVSYRLSQRGLDHLVLERHDHVGHSWSHDRWDSFTLVTPNWFMQLPDFPYAGDRPDAFLPRDEIVRYLEGFHDFVRPPMHYGTEVTGLQNAGDHYLLDTTAGQMRARNVVVATGFFHRARVLDMATALPPDIVQLHPYNYKNPGQLPDGGVLIVGSSMSGIQICEDFLEEGRSVYMAVGDGHRMPRRYRGRDVFAWLAELGLVTKPVDPVTHAERYAPSLMLSGARGGRGLNLHYFAARGVHLAGKLLGFDGTRAFFDDDLNRKIAESDAASRTFKSAVDTLILDHGLEAPGADTSNTDEGLPTEGGPYLVPDVLDLRERGITSVIWATGFACDYDWIRMPVLDERGFPRQHRGVSGAPGLYFCGQHWLHTFASGGFHGLGDDPAHISDHIGRRLGAIA
jgi:putative flavoprotein involved in K+ transport